MPPSRQKKIEEWFANKCSGLTCAPCGKQDWAILQPACALIMMDGAIVMNDVGATNLADAELASFIALVCRACGYTMLFSAAVTGLDEPPP
jgi:predicted nucleic-acid-binding Zn-ribbon protein